MAAGELRGQSHHITPDGFQRLCTRHSTYHIMKQVEVCHQEDLDKDRFQVHHRVQNPGKAKRPSSYKRRSCAPVEAGVKLQRRSSDAGRPREPGMANREKENELTCPDGGQGLRCYNNGEPWVNAPTSRMAGASSKCSDFTELSKDHEAMTRILFGRDLRLKVALTLWRRSACELVAYLTRLQDTRLLIDCLPILTDNLQTETSCLTLGCCVDLLPQVKGLLLSRYEEHIVVGLRWLQAVIRKWWAELSEKERRLQDPCSEHRNVEVMRLRLKDLQKEGTRLCSLPGSSGDLAKAVAAHLSQLP
uniref:Katanin p80 subunit B-like 1 n=1 Tax=Oryzias latipes TaxID=8090 RepID=A0A3P9HZY8_ORYLA